MFRITTDKRLANLLKITSNNSYERGFNDGLEWVDIQDGYEIAKDEWEAREGRHGSDFILNLVREREGFEEDVFTLLPE